MTSSEIDGCPGGFGWRYFAATRRLCQRGSVPDVTILRPRSASQDSTATSSR